MDRHTHSEQVQRLGSSIRDGRPWSEDEKLRTVTESLGGPRLVSSTARRHFTIAVVCLAAKLSRGADGKVRDRARICAGGRSSCRARALRQIVDAPAYAIPKTKAPNSGVRAPLMLAATDAVHAAIYISTMNGAVTYRGTCYGTCDEPHSRPCHATRRITDVCTVHHSVRRPRNQHRDASDYAHQSGR